MANGAPTVSNGLVISGITTTSEIFVGNNIKLDPISGIVTATSFVGDGSGLTGAGPSLANGANNRVVTSSSATALNGEANLTFNGGETGDAQLTVHAAEANANSDSELILETSNDFATSVIMFKDSTAEAGSIAYNHGDNYIKFSTNGTNGGTERVRIDAGGNMNVTGVVTATAFTGDGSALTGTGVGGNTSVNTTGIITATAVVSDFQPRNMIINGAMQINQRLSGTLTINSSSSQYPCDRWVSRGEGGSKTFTIEKTSIASSGQGIRNALKVTSSQAASVGSSDIFNVRQMIEGYNIQRLNLGEAGCASMALSFTAYSSVAGTHSGAIQNTNQDRSYPFTYTLVANTWTDVKITIPPITSGSFNEGTGVGLRVVFDLGCGNNFRGTANQWNSAQDEGATGAVRILETNGATWYVTKVQLEEGTVCTPFEKRMVTEETILCERYYHQTQGNMFWMTNVNGSDHYKPIQFPTTMRTSPSITFYNVTGDGGGGSASGSTPNGYQARLNGNGRHLSWAHKASAEL